MPDAMRWRKLERFYRPSLPGLNNLRRAQRAGLTVPPTWWLWAGAARNQWEAAPPPELEGKPLIIRSCAPTEDTPLTSDAGRLLSLPVTERWEFPGALRQVVDALPHTAQGVPRGAVFVQPLPEGDEQGIVFFDGFYFECATAKQTPNNTTIHTNFHLMAGQERSQNRNGHLARGEPWSQWLERIYAVFGRDAGRDTALDIEFTREGERLTLLQVRPAHFAVERNRTLSLVNPFANRPANDPANHLANDPVNDPANHLANDPANHLANDPANDPANHSEMPGDSP